MKKSDGTQGEEGIVLMGPNHTQVSNTFIDEYMNRLTPSANLVFLAITRKTVGWHKATDCISQGQLMDITGITGHHTIRDAIDELVHFRLINEIERPGLTSVFEVGYQQPRQPLPNPSATTADATSATTADTKETPKDTRVKKEEHPIFKVPVGITQYNNLCERHSKKRVDEAIEKRINWEATYGNPEAKDYAAAAANWLKKNEEFHPSPPPEESRYCQNIRSDPITDRKYKCGLTLYGGKCYECDR